MLRNLKNLPNFQNHKIGEKEEEEEEENTSECVRSQKAMLKIKIAEMKCFWRLSIARTWQKNNLYMVQVGIAKNIEACFINSNFIFGQ